MDIAPSNAGTKQSGLQSVEQAFDLGDVVALSACQEEADRVTQSIGSSMDLGAQAAF
ncbi:hypothetical protein MNQ96_01475 [Sphingopyxis granuli]|nr:hypothetical protein [Sphingopyxis granuli]UNK79793.1 hypothetical protein MNQ96_01475 [Sphingopyxis granuli]